MKPTPPIAAFLRTATEDTVSVNESQRERVLKVKRLEEQVAKLHPVVQTTLQSNRERIRNAASRGELSNFAEGGYVLGAQEQFFAGEKLVLRWHGPRRELKALSYYVFQVEDLPNGSLVDVHGTQLKFYRDSSLDTCAILPHVLSSGTGMPVARLMKLVKDADGLKILVRWKGISNSDDTLEPIE